MINTPTTSSAQPPAHNPNPNLRLVLQTIAFLAVLAALASGGLTEAMAGLLLSRLP